MDSLSLAHGYFSVTKQKNKTPIFHNAALFNAIAQLYLADTLMKNKCPMINS